MPNPELPEGQTRKIGIPKSLEYVLKRDMMQFEFVKARDNTLAVNRFINALIQGYFEEYKETLFGLEESMQALLAPYIQNRKTRDSVIAKILAGTGAEDEAERKADGKPIRFRPTGDSVDIDAEIYRMDVYMSDFYRNMFLSYSRKPVHERERIIFRGVSDVVEKACREHTELTFAYGDKARSHTVVPYKLVYGSDEQFNYLLCQEISQNGKRLEAKSYRLRRIRRPKPRKARGTPDPEVRKFLDRMIKYSPQYEINEDTEICVEFTAEGRKDFDMIYTNRPIPARKDPPDAAGNSRYYFSCSQEQVFNYFKRFNPGEMRIVYPEKLKASLRGFHEKHLEFMKD